jgi:hypothetical protein
METKMKKSERNAAVLKDLLAGEKREVVIEKYGITDDKLVKIVLKAGEAATEQPVAVALKEPVVRRNANGAPTRKAVPKKVSRLNPEVTERMKVRVIQEARTVNDLNDRLAAARKRRNDTIRALCDRGLSEREVGELTGMTGPRINQIYFGTNGSRS